MTPERKAEMLSRMPALSRARVLVAEREWTMRALGRTAAWLTALTLAVGYLLWRTW